MNADPFGSMTARYGLAVLVAAVALLPWSAAGGGLKSPALLLFLVAVMVSSWYGGFGPGLLTTLVGAVAGMMAWHSVPHIVAIDAHRAFQLGLFLLVAVFVSYLNETLRHAQLDTSQAEERLRRQLAFTDAITRNLGDGVFALNRSGRLLYMNPSAERLLGWAEADLLGQDILHVISLDAMHTFSAMQSDTTGDVQSDIYRHRDGTTFPVEYVSSPIRAEDRVTGTVVTFRDVTERQQFEDQLRHQALHDALTGLPNRVLFDDRLQFAIRNAERGHSAFAVFLMDLDRFKEINDTFGHHYGDMLLQQASARLVEVLRHSDTVARLGGDEFAALVPLEVPGDATLVAGKILDALQQPFKLEEQSLEIEASIGITLFPEHGTDAATLLRRTDVAMYAAKRRNEPYALYSMDQDEYSPTRLALVSELRQAIDRDELLLYYQPKVSLRSRNTRGVEALVRWQHPERGLLTPDQFVPVAEHTGLIKQMSLWVLNAALRQSRIWHDAGLEVQIAVNLSARNLHDRQFPAILKHLLQVWKLSPSCLEIEITESAVMADAALALEVLGEVHRMGIRIAIDDFGTGYSSLAYLTRLPADEIKIDKSFVLAMDRNDDDAHIARSVIELGHNLGLQIVAEGVENEGAWRLLSSLNCDLAQGYYLGRPMPAAEYPRWLSRWGGALLEVAP